jgi:DNA sulfur modification protein DndC
MSGLIATHGLKTIVRNKIDVIKKMYRANQLPWVVGYSGGKDSTAVVQLIFYALREMPKDELKKDVYIISSDTLIENPLILEYIDKSLYKMEEYARKEGLPICVQKVFPRKSETFWTLLIGKGYPPPRQKFRWCTDRLKIEPTNHFILEKVSQHGEVIIVLGIRKAESISRNQVIESHTIEGKILKRHSTLQNAYIFAPIEDFTKDDVWEFLLSVSSPWGADNGELLALYQNSNDNSECPLVIDKSSPPCGNSRFGCWVCTVVREDKSLKGFIENGEDWLSPLLEFRNWLCEIRDLPEKREDKRINGSVYYVNRNNARRRGLGPFNLEARKEILEKLLETEKVLKNNREISLIQPFELDNIRKLWIEGGDWEDSLPKIYKRIYGEELKINFSERPLYSQREIDILRDLCNKNDISFDLINKLVNLEVKYYGLKNRAGILKNMESILKQDWLHQEILGELGEEDEN